VRWVKVRDHRRRNHHRETGARVPISGVVADRLVRQRGRIAMTVISERRRARSTQTGCVDRIRRTRGAGAGGGDQCNGRLSQPSHLAARLIQSVVFTVSVAFDVKRMPAPAYP